MPAVIPTSAPRAVARRQNMSAEKCRRKLRDRGERQQADAGELRFAGRAIVEVGERKDRDDGDAAHRQQQFADARRAPQRLRCA